MRNRIIAVGAATLGLACLAATPAPPPPALEWAYPHAKDAPGPGPGPGPFQAPGSSISFTKAQMEALDGSPDWFPAEHPPLPKVVEHGAPGVLPCGLCHGVQGEGDLGAPNMAGLRASYIRRQVKAFAAGQRRSSLPEAHGAEVMAEIASKLSDADLAEAARYFASLPRPHIAKVVERETGPAVLPHKYGHWVATAGAPEQPLAGRVLELPEDEARDAIGDPHAQRIVYAPIGSLARGRTLVRAGGHGGQPCAACHGEGLHGTAMAPPLAGRSANYLARQLWDIKSGARGGSAAALMQAPVRALRTEDVTPVAAYLASLKP